MKFYLGTHMPHWLTKPGAPFLFVSHRRLHRRTTMPRAETRWALDSGGFTELSMHGEWRTTPDEYIADCNRYTNEIGRLDWIAPQDWMCEPFMLAKTGLTVAQHQQNTITNYLTLRTLDADLPIIPVLQGWDLADYLSHIDQYAAVGVDLHAERVVGLGSVCRRQATAEIGELVANISATGIRFHGFGVKGAGIRRYGWALASADSMSWSFRGRRINPCPHSGVKSCANCYPHALEWRAKAISQSSMPVQMAMPT